MGRTPCCEKFDGLRKGPWTSEEDQKLIDYIHKNGHGNWRTLPKNAGLQRCGKSCRLRWVNYLRSDIKRGKFSSDEEETIIQLHSVLGNKWSTIATRLPGRTDNEIKNYWNTHIRKKLVRMGIDPVTHNPRLDLIDLSSILSSSLYNLPLMSLARIQRPLANLEFLSLAASLISSQCNPNPNLIYQNSQENPFENTPQVQENRNLAQDQTLIHEIPSCVPLSKIMEPNVHDQLPSSISGSRPQTCQSIDWLTCNDLENINIIIGDDYGYRVVDPDQSNFSHTSSVRNSSTCTPSSSSAPMNSNSNSTYINGSTIEEDKEISYCSSLFKNEYHELANANVFM